MGTWGTRVYEDDTALDIRHDFMNQLNDGVAVDDIERMVEEESIDPDQQDNNDVVWLALCCAELETGTLTDKVKNIALEIIASNRQYGVWLVEGGKELAGARKRELTLVRKYIENYDGTPVKRKSWVQLQKEEASYADEDEDNWTTREKLDDASWHSEAAEKYKNEDDESVLVRAGAHIAVFVHWLITRGYFVAEDTETQKVAAGVKSGALSADQFLYKYMDGKLFLKEVAPDVQDFALAYYPERCAADYQKTIMADRELYGFVPTLEEQKQLALVIDEQLAGYKKAPYKPLHGSSAPLLYLRMLPLSFWVYATIAVVCFSISAICFWYLLFRM